MEFEKEDLNHGKIIEEALNLSREISKQVFNNVSFTIEGEMERNGETIKFRTQGLKPIGVLRAFETFEVVLKKSPGPK